MRDYEEWCQKGKEEFSRRIINLSVKSEESVPNYCRYRSEIQIAGVKLDDYGSIEEPQCVRHANLQYSKTLFLRLSSQSSFWVHIIEHPHCDGSKSLQKRAVIKIKLQKTLRCGNIRSLSRFIHQSHCPIDPSQSFQWHEITIQAAHRRSGRSRCRPVQS